MSSGREDTSDNNDSTLDGTSVNASPEVAHSVMDTGHQSQGNTRPRPVSHEQRETRRRSRTINVRRPEDSVAAQNNYFQYSLMVSLAATGYTSQYSSVMQPHYQITQNDVEHATIVRNVRPRSASRQLDRREVPLINAQQPMEPISEPGVQGVDFPQVDPGITVHGGHARNHEALHPYATSVRPETEPTHVVRNGPGTNRIRSIEMQQQVAFARQRRRQVFALLRESQRQFRELVEQEVLVRWHSEDVNWTYEEMLALIEILGNANVGLTEEEIMAQLRSQIYQSTDENLCAICLENFVEGDTFTELDCSHKYHLDCITDWLLRRNHCPICRRPALST